MKRARIWRILWSAGLIIMLLLISSVAIAGSPEQENPLLPDTETGPVPPLEPPEVLAPGEGELEEMGPAVVQEAQAATGLMMNYQGFLTNASGAPLNGAYSMTFRLFPLATEGTAAWGPETHTNVAISKGLFAVVLGSITPIPPGTFYRQLYLETTVGGTVLPRQMLHAAPYALGLALGAEVNGTTASASAYGLRVVNGGGRGLYADSAGQGNYALYSADVVFSAEGYSGPDTVAWVPGNNLRVWVVDAAKGHVEQWGAGLARVNMDADNATVQVGLPVQLERPYGHAYRVTKVTLYYNVGAPSYIDEVIVEGRSYNTNTVIEEISDTNGTSGTYASYEVIVDPPIKINNDQAISDIWLVLKSGTPNGQNGYVDVYAARLTLQNAY